MGRDKTFLKIAGTPIFERVLGIFRESFTRIILVGDREERFADYGLPVLPDIYPGSSLGGLYTGLHHAETEYVFVSASDLPFANGTVLRYLCTLKSGFDAVVPTVANSYEPLFALYAKRCLEPIRSQLERGNFCAYAYYQQLRIRYVPQEELARFDSDGRTFLNINTPADFAGIEGDP